MSIPQCIILEFPDTLSQSISGNSNEKLHCGNIVNMPDLILSLWQTIIIVLAKVGYSLIWNIDTRLL